MGRSGRALYRADLDLAHDISVTVAAALRRCIASMAMVSSDVFVSALIL
jgi:hypothetical protein